jgi:hypothetical protein
VNLQKRCGLPEDYKVLLAFLGMCHDGIPCHSKHPSYMKHAAVRMYKI